MLIWLVVACFQGPFEGGQQGEDVHDDTGLASDSGETDASEDSGDPTDTGAAVWTGTIEITAGTSCTGPLRLNADGVGEGTCAFPDGAKWALTLIGERDGDEVSGTIAEGGTWSGAYSGDTVSGSVEGVRDGQDFSGTFTASR